MTHNDVFLAIRDKLVSSTKITVDVNATFVAKDNIRNQIVIEPATETNTNTRFASGYEADTLYNILITCIGSNTKEADDLFDALKEVVEENDFGVFDVVGVSSVYIGEAQNDNVYHRKAMTVELR